MLEHLVKKYHLELKSGGDFSRFFEDPEFQKMNAVSLKDFLQKTKIQNHLPSLNALFSSVLLYKLDVQELYSFIKNSDGAINLLWMLAFESKKCDIFNNNVVLRLTSDQLAFLVGQPNEDVKGQNVLLYVTEHFSENEIVKFLSSATFIKAKTSSANFVRTQFTSFDDSDNDVLHIALREHNKFKALINSPVLLDITDQEKYDLLFNTDNNKVSIIDVVATDKINTQVLLDSDQLSSMNSNEKISIMQRIIKTEGTVEEQVDLDKIGLVMDTKFFQSLDCAQKISVVTCDHVDLLGDDCLSISHSLCHGE